LPHQNFYPKPQPEPHKNDAVQQHWLKKKLIIFWISGCEQELRELMTDLGFAALGRKWPTNTIIFVK
jgi:hypothetical protein